MDITNASAIVTGGAGGLGEQTVRRLVAAGAKVVIADLASEKAESLAEELGSSAEFVETDATSEADVLRAQMARDLAGIAMRRLTSLK